MPAVALITIIVWIAVVAVGRGIVHGRSTGTAAMSIRDGRGSAQWWARVLGSLGFVLLVLGAVAPLLGLPASPMLDQPVVALAGLALAAVGTVGTVLAQVAMGPSWRGDVDPDARTPLITTGPFRWVRNPILTATGITAVGIVLMTPNAFSVLGLAAILASHQVLVRRVEEPYLERVHGDPYRAYAARTGQFIPGIGRKRAPDG